MINSTSAVAEAGARAIAPARDRGLYKHHTIHPIVPIPTHNTNVNDVNTSIKVHIKD